MHNTVKIRRKPKLKNKNRKSKRNWFQSIQCVSNPWWCSIQYWWIISGTFTRFIDHSNSFLLSMNHNDMINNFFKQFYLDIFLKNSTLYLCYHWFLFAVRCQHVANLRQIFYARTIRLVETSKRKTKQWTIIGRILSEFWNFNREISNYIIIQGFYSSLSLYNSGIMGRVFI